MSAESKNRGRQILKDLGIMLGLFFAALLINYGLDYLNFQETNIVLVFLLSSVLTARYTTGYFYGLFSSLMDLIAFDIIFVAPFYSVSVINHVYMMTFIFMFVITFYISLLTSQAKAERNLARKKEAEANALYELTSELTSAKSITEIISKSLIFIYQILDCKCVFLYHPETQDETCYVYGTFNGVNTVMEKKDAMQLNKKTAKAMDGSEYLTGPVYDQWPVVGHHETYGYIGVPTGSEEEFDNSEITMLKAMTNAISVVLDHFLALQNQEKDKQEAAQERFRSNLLRSISHDLRTPLTGIMGTSELIMQMTEDDSELHLLSSNIHREATWLRDLVQNILSLTRLQSGKVHIRKELQIVEEVVQAAVDALRLRYPNREFVFQEPEDVITCKMDSKLIQQVLINLLDNANKHTPLGKQIKVEIEEISDKDEIAISVIDQGVGLAEEQLNKIFTMFYTTRSNDAEATRGFGLGLPICDSIVKAHGGTISTSNNKDGGACFRVVLPKE